MDKLQQVFEHEFNTQIKSLIDEALERTDISALVTNTVTERLNNGTFQQYVNDTIKQHVNNISISDTAISRLEEKGQLVLQQQMPRVISIAQDRIDSLMAEVVDQKLKNFQFPEQSIDPKLIDVSRLEITTANILDYGNTAGIEDMANNVQLTVMNDSVVIENKVITDQVQANTLIADTLVVRDVATDQPWILSLKDEMKNEILDSIPEPKKPKDWSFKVAEMEARIKVNEERGGNLKQLEVAEKHC